MRSLRSLFVALFLAVPICVSSVPAQSGQNGKRANLTAGEKALVSASRAAIISTGISARYFDRHFTLDRVFDRKSDRRVVWTYAVGEHKTNVNDAIGSYTRAGGRQQTSHSIVNFLIRSKNITSVISQKKAASALRQCIGEYSNESIVFQAYGQQRRATLLMTGLSIPEPVQETVSDPPPPLPPDVDSIRQGRKKQPVMYIGYVNLETGSCTKGIARAGSPKPF